MFVALQAYHALWSIPGDIWARIGAQTLLLLRYMPTIDCIHVSQAPTYIGTCHTRGGLAPGLHTVPCHAGPCECFCPSFGSLQQVISNLCKEGKVPGDPKWSEICCRTV